MQTSLVIPIAEPVPQGDLVELSPAIVRVWRLKTGLGLGAFVLAALIYDVWHFFDQGRGMPFGVLPALLLVATLSIAYWLPPFRYRFWRYALRTQELIIVHGVFNRVHTIIPLKRIQHLDVSQDLFEREYELGKLIIHTAGTRSSDVILPGLDLAEAERLRDQMKNFITDEAL